MKIPCSIHSHYVSGCLACEAHKCSCQAGWMCPDCADQLRADLADALDVKSGNGPTALTMVVNERDQLRAEVDRLNEELEHPTGEGWKRSLEKKEETICRLRNKLKVMNSVAAAHFEKAVEAQEELEEIKKHQDLTHRLMRSGEERGRKKGLEEAATRCAEIVRCSVSREEAIEHIEKEYGFEE